MKYLALLGMAALAYAGPTPRTEINSVYQALEVAARKKDVNAILARMTQDVVYIDKGAKYSRAQLAPQLKASFGSLKTVTKATITVKSVKINGTSAVAVVVRRLEGKIANSATKKDSTIAMIGETQDTLTKDKSGWKIKKVVVVKKEMLLDGKPFVPPSTTRD